jgi:hypothetical protein
MRATRTGLLILLLVALALNRAPALSPLPPNPHLSLNAAGMCDECHAYYRETMDPHDFVVAIPERCLECHSAQELGRSHPIGVDPSHSAARIEVPAELPLEDGMVSCGTCHNPHMASLSQTRAYPAQEVAFRQMEGRVETLWYKTLFLRKSDPERGFEPLCMACHKDY